MSAWQPSHEALSVAASSARRGEAAEKEPRQGPASSQGPGSLRGVDASGERRGPAWVGSALRGAPEGAAVHEASAATSESRQSRAAIGRMIVAHLLPGAPVRYEETRRRAFAPTTECPHSTETPPASALTP